MPGNPPPFDNETDGILLYLIQQRDGLRFAAYGLTEEQLRQRATPASALTVGGLLKHATMTERGWIDILAGAPVEKTEEEYGSDFVVADDESLASLLDLQAATAARTEEVVRACPAWTSRCSCPRRPGIRRTPMATPPAGSCCTWSRSWRGMPATPTSSASTSTAPPCTS